MYVGPCARCKHTAGKFKVKGHIQRTCIMSERLIVVVSSWLCEMTPHRLASVLCRLLKETRIRTLALHGLIRSDTLVSLCSEYNRWGSLTLAHNAQHWIIQA